jgi:DNA polymerase elongation subunit (family B)
MQNPNYWLFYNKEKDTRVIFLDTFNFYKSSLENLFPKEKVKIDFEKYDYRDLSLIKKRCKMDVFLTCKLAFDLKGVSASDMAFKVFREENKFYIEKIETPIAKESYYGGRVECYINNLCVEDVKYYDFNSLYPSVMKGNLIPIKYVQTLENPSFELVQELIKRNFFIFAEVEVDVDNNVKIPPFPYRGKDGKLYFPTGRFTTFLAMPEIILGLELGFIKRFLKVEQYYAKKIFDNYVDKYYRLRQENPDKKEFYKLHLNSLYGKFGQREHITSIINTDDTTFVGLIEIEGEKYYIYKGYGFKSEVTEKRKYNVAVASAITSYARVKLYRLMQSIDFDVVYCDTDSVFTTRKLETSNELGRLKLECEGTFLGFRAKCYVIKDKVKFKGGKVSLELLQRGGQEICVEIKKFPTLKEFIKNGGIVKTLKVVKKFNLIDDKRKGKGVTQPFNVMELVKKWKK